MSCFAFKAVHLFDISNYIFFNCVGICILKLGLDSHFKSQIVNVVLVIVSCIQIVTGVFVLGDALVYDIMEDIKQLRRVHV